MRFPNLYPFARKKNSSPVEYASFSSRTFALTVDMILLFLLMMPLTEFISRQLYPDFYIHGGAQQVKNLMLGYAADGISKEEVMNQLKTSGVFTKMSTDYLMHFLIAGALIVLAWVKFNTTPGMFIMRSYVADAKTGGAPSLRQYIWRYVIGVVAVLPLMLGMLTMFFNKRKMALHDFAAGTVVLRRKFKFEISDEPEETAEEADTSRE